VSSEKYRGFVARIGVKDGKAKKPPYRAYKLFSVKIEKEDGTEYADWVGFGFDPVPFSEGDFVEFEAEKGDNGYINFVKGTGTLVKNPPARASAKKAGSPSAGTGTEGDTGSSSGDANRQTQIVLQHSQEMAVRMVELLHGLDALPISAAATKAGEAKRFSEVNAIVDKLTVRFYNDVVTGRLLTTVADTVQDTKADGAIPGADDGKQEDRLQ